METVQGLEVPFPPGRRAFVSLGVFDGVHLGHQRMLSALVRWARQNGGRSTVLTFQRHPKAVLDSSSPRFITSLQHRLRLFESLGIDICGVLTFDKEFASMSPEAFVREVIWAWAGAGGVLLGHDQRFGHGGRGDVTLLRRLAPELNLEVREMAAVRVAGKVVSSTAIRRAILSGDLDEASAMLGRPVSILGTVVHGQRRGHRLGYPTANLDVHHEVQLPEGVYAASVCREGEVLPAVANIGRRPSFARTGPAYLDREPLVEVHLLDFRDELYGEDIEVRFHKKLRDEQPFREEGPLRAQIEMDVETARAYFDGAAERLC